MPDLKQSLEDDWKIFQERHTSHAHLKNELTGIALTDAWSKLALDTTNYDIKALGGFTFDDANDRFYWDQSGAIDKSLPAFFIGDVGLQVTAGIGAGVTITMGLFIEGTLILETPITFGVIDKIQGYGANGVLLDALDDDLLQSGSYYEFWAKAGTSETPTVSLNYLNTTIKRD